MYLSIIIQVYFKVDYVKLLHFQSSKIYHVL